MELILPNTDNMIFNTSCMHSISLVVDISFCVSGLAHLHMPLRPPLVSIQELPITLYKLVRRRFGGRNENSREENNILSMCAFAVFSILIIFTCNYRERRHLRYQILYRGIIWGWRSPWLFQHLHSLWMWIWKQHCIVHGTITIMRRKRETSSYEGGGEVGYSVLDILSTAGGAECTLRILES